MARIVKECFLLVSCISSRDPLHRPNEEKIKREKVKGNARIQTHNLSITRYELHCCAATAAYLTNGLFPDRAKSLFRFRENIFREKNVLIRKVFAVDTINMGFRVVQMRID